MKPAVCIAVDGSIAVVEQIIFWAGQVGLPGDACTKRSTCFVANANGCPNSRHRYVCIETALQGGIVTAAIVCNLNTVRTISEVAELAVPVAVNFIAVVIVQIIPWVGKVLLTGNSSRKTSTGFIGYRYRPHCWHRGAKGKAALNSSVVTNRVVLYVHTVIAISDIVKGSGCIAAYQHVVVIVQAVLRVV